MGHDMVQLAAVRVTGRAVEEKPDLFYLQVYLLETSISLTNGL